MKLQRWMGCAAVLLACGAVASQPAAPPATAPGRTPVTIALGGTPMTMDAAVRMAEQRYHARVVRAETQRDNGQVVYVLRLLNEAGRVWTVRVDAASGAVLQ